MNGGASMIRNETYRSFFFLLPLILSLLVGSWDGVSRAELPMLLFFNSSAHLDNVRLARQCNAMQGRAEKPHRKTYLLIKPPLLNDR